MKKRAIRKLSLSRETVHRLTDSSLRLAGGVELEPVEIDKGDTALSITVCTQVISDCRYCTTPLNSCPGSMRTNCTCA